jgi:hypothetical protein
MAKDAVARLEENRQKLIQELLAKREQIENQLKGLGYSDKK